MLKPSEKSDPFEIFTSWFDKAKDLNLDYPDAMTLATVDSSGQPDARIVLLKEYDKNGFVFYTNLTSQKGQQLAGQPKASLCFYWMDLEKQVRIKGDVEMVDNDLADSYFASRPKKSQIGAWASKQSQVMEDALALEKRVARKMAKYGLKKVPRPEFWSGYRVKPFQIEFWENRLFRLHERWQFNRAEDGSWYKQKLYP